MKKRWIPETLFDDMGFRMTFAAERVLYETPTGHHHLILFEHQKELLRHLGERVA